MQQRRSRMLVAPLLCQHCTIHLSPLEIGSHDDYRYSSDRMVVFATSLKKLEARKFTLGWYSGQLNVKVHRSPTAAVKKN